MLTFLVFFPMVGALVVATLPREQERQARWMALGVTGAVLVVSPGWHGDRYCDGRRYWDRDEWKERHRHHGHGPDHSPPGHAKKGEC